MRKWIISILSATGIFFAFVHMLEAENYKQVRIYDIDCEDAYLQLVREVECYVVNRNSYSVDAYVSDSQYQELQSLGYSMTIYRANIPVGLTAEDILDYNEAMTTINNLAAQHPSIAKVYQIGTSVQGQAIKALKISDNVSSTEAEPVIYIDATSHGNEVMNAGIVCYAASRLVNDYGLDTLATRLVDSCQIWICPMLNPDGRMKNPPTRENANDKDLNRDFSKERSATVTGRFTQPESRVVRDFLAGHLPSGVLTYHSYGQLIMNPRYYQSPSYNDIADTMRDAIGSELQYYDGTQCEGLSYCYWVVDARPKGAEDEYAAYTYTIPSFTIETGSPAVDRDALDSIKKTHYYGILAFIEAAAKVTPLTPPDYSLWLDTEVKSNKKVLFQCRYYTDVFFSARITTTAGSKVAVLGSTATELPKKSKNFVWDASGQPNGTYLFILDIVSPAGQWYKATRTVTVVSGSSSHSSGVVPAPLKGTGVVSTSVANSRFYYDDGSDYGRRGNSWAEDDIPDGWNLHFWYSWEDASVYKYDYAVGNSTIQVYNYWYDRGVYQYLNTKQNTSYTAEVYVWLTNEGYSGYWPNGIPRAGLRILSDDGTTVLGSAYTSARNLWTKLTVRFNSSANNKVRMELVGGYPYQKQWFYSASIY